MARQSKKPRFSVQVTPRDIEKAHINDSYNCVVSQAIARSIPDATRIETDVQAIRFTRGDQRYVYLTPYAVQGYVVAFDAGEAIHPFTFQLRDPQLVKVKRRTPAGKAAGTAYDRVRRPPDGKKKSTESDAGDPKAAYAEARRQYSHAPQSVTKGEGRSAAPPRVHKKKTRTYGHRDLRVNRG